MGKINVSISMPALATLLALFGCAPASHADPVVPIAADAAHRASGPTFQVFTAGSTPGLPATAVPRDIVAGPNGTMWFTDLNTPAIGRISSSLKIREFTRGLQSGAQPYSIVAGTDGNMWFSDETGAIGRITPSGTITEFRSARLAAAGPVGITVGSDDAIWAMGLGTRSLLARVTLDGKISLFDIPQELIPDGSLEAGSRGNLWFFASRKNHAVVFVRRSRGGTLFPYATGLITKGEPCCPNLAPKHIAIGPDANPWFTTPYFGSPSTSQKMVGTFASGQTALFPVALGTISYPVYPSGIVSTHRYLWFSGSDPLSFNGALWRMTTAGKQVVYPIAYDPAGLAAASGTTLWFTSQVQGRPPQIVEATF